MQKKDIRIFISYSSKDRDLREMLESGLKSHLAHRKGYNFSLWSDMGIDIGADWKESINNALKNSQAALLMVSASFITSEFITEIELQDIFFKRKDQKDFLIFPVLTRDYNFKDFEEISRLNFFKTYYSDYEFDKPLEKHKLLPFDKLADGKTTDRLLNLYYKNLADFIYNAVRNAISI